MGWHGAERDHRNLKPEMRRGCPLQQLESKAGSTNATPEELKPVKAFEYQRVTQYHSSASVPSKVESGVLERAMKVAPDGDILRLMHTKLCCIRLPYPSRRVDVGQI